MKETIGIIDYSVYIPRLRIKAKEYVEAWGSFSARGVKEKSVMDFDEDVLTMAISSVKSLLEKTNPASIDSLSFASTTFPYLEKVMSGALISATGLPNHIQTTEHGTSTKAGMEAFLTAGACCDNYGLAVMADSPKASVKDSVEHGLGAGAISFLLGEENLIAEIEGSAHHVEERLGERLKPTGSDYLKDLGLGDYVQEGYKESIQSSLTRLMEKLNRKIDDYDYFVTQQMDVKISWRSGLGLGFNEGQMKTGFLMTQLGDTGVCSPLLGLANVLDKAATDQKILLIGYGGGQGSSAISIKTTPLIEKVSSNLQDQLEEKEYITYLQYLKLKDALK